jgi:hypothetical protein
LKNSVELATALKELERREALASAKAALRLGLATRDAPALRSALAKLMQHDLVGSESEAEEQARAVLLEIEAESKILEQAEAEASVAQLAAERRASLDRALRRALEEADLPVPGSLVDNQQGTLNFVLPTANVVETLLI